MSSIVLKRGMAVIWTQPDDNRKALKMMLGVVQAPVDSERITIEIIEPDKDEKSVVTVPVTQVRPI